MKYLCKRESLILVNNRIPWDTPSDSAPYKSQDRKRFFIFTDLPALVTFFYNVISGRTPSLLSSMVSYKSTKNHLRGNKSVIQQFYSYYMKNSIIYRSAVHYKDRKDIFIKQLDLMRPPFPRKTRT